MKIKVTEDDIQRGESCNPFRCPIALAIHRSMGTIPQTYAVEVQPDVIRFEGGKDCNTPETVEQFIALYDTLRGKQLVAPFEFELPIEEKL